MVGSDATGMGATMPPRLWPRMKMGISVGVEVDWSFSRSALIAAEVYGKFSFESVMSSFESFGKSSALGLSHRHTAI